MKELILIGGGGHCKSVIDVAESAGYKIKGILDLPSFIGSHVLDYEVIGSDDDINKYLNGYLFMITIGFIKDPVPRYNIYNKIKALGGEFATIISPNAHMSRYAKIGEGSIAMNGVSINAEAKIGVNSIINTSANIEHDSTIGNHTHISTGSIVNGNCHIGDRVFIGSLSSVYNGISIVDNVIIGGGSIVRNNIENKGTYIGNPIKSIAK